MKQPEPIRVKDRFIDSKKRTWEVIECKPGGRVTLFHRESSRFWDTYKAQIRDMQREDRTNG